MHDDVTKKRCSWVGDNPLMLLRASSIRSSSSIRLVRLRARGTQNVVTDVPAEVSLLDAYTGKTVMRALGPQQTFEEGLPLDEFGGWYDLRVTVSGDASFKYQLAGHVETGKESISDPALGGLVTLKS